MYKQTVPYKNEPIISVIRTTDGACIPFDNNNVDYQKYLEWVSQGNQPEQANE